MSRRVLFLLAALLLLLAWQRRRRRQRGVYHTPAHVIDYVLANPPYRAGGNHE